MNGLLLNFTKEDEVIKSNSKKLHNTHSHIQLNNDDSFAFLMENLLSDIPDGKEKNFLMTQIFHQNQNISPKNRHHLRASFSNAPLTDTKPEKKETVTLETLLQIVSLLQTHDPKTPLQFPTQSPKLQTALLDLKVQDAFKQVHTVKDLLNLAEQLNISVKHITFMKEEAALDNKTKQISHALNSISVLNIVKKLPHKSQIHQNDINSSKSTDKLQKSDKNILQTLLQNAKPASHIKTLHESRKDQTSIKQEHTDFSHSAHISSKNNKDISVIPTKTQISQQMPQSQKHMQTDLATSDTTDKVHIPKNTQNHQQTDELSIHKKEKKPFHITPQSEHHTKVNITDTIQENTDNKNTARSTTTLIYPKIEKNDTTFSPDEPAAEQDTTHSHHTVSHETKTEFSQLHKKENPLPLKQTFETFGQDFKEYMERYKPPLMKIKMQLNPGTLGDVDVTMVNRGNNLHVTIQSNPNTIALFTQNQTEFKNALVNMGFTGLQMSFGENREGNKGQQHTKSSHTTRSSSEDEHHENDHFDMIVPRYI